MIAVGREFAFPLDYASGKHWQLTSSPATVDTYSKQLATRLGACREIAELLVREHREWHRALINSRRRDPRIYSPGDIVFARRAMRSDAARERVGKLEYKFTRGNWDTVEGQENGKACPNRALYRKSDFRLEEIPVDIKGWEDLTGTFNFYSIYDLLILFSAFQCILLLVAIPTMQDYNRKANQWLLLSIAFTAIVLIMKTLTGYRVIAEQYSRLLLIPDFALFLYAPLFYFYLHYPISPLD